MKAAGCVSGSLLGEKLSEESFSPDPFYKRVSLNGLSQYCYSFHFLCCSASVLAVVSV